MRSNDTSAAIGILNKLSEDPTTPVGIRSRAIEMLAALGAQ
jgi:uncharacterized protein (UPF0147 family)